MVATNDKSGENAAVRVLDAATGREIATLPDAEPESCVADAMLVACLADSPKGRPQLVTYRLADRAVKTVPVEEHTRLLSVVQGRISVEVAGRKIVTIDRTGIVVDDKPPGELLAMTDDLVFVKATRDDKDEFLAVYRMNG
ncbi:MAG TPA: hypothetical protein VGD71_31390 [Kribbella sp.]